MQSTPFYLSLNASVLHLDCNPGAWNGITSRGLLGDGEGSSGPLSSAVESLFVTFTNRVSLNLRGVWKDVPEQEEYERSPEGKCCGLYGASTTGSTTAGDEA